MKKRIIVDMDCILVDMLGPYLALVSMETGHVCHIPDLTRWEMHKCSPLDRLTPDYLYGIFRRKGFFRNLPPLPGALDGLKALADAGHEIVIVSTPSGPQSAQEKYEWLDEHLPWFHHGDVFLGAHKHMVCADLIVDDKAETLERYLKEWPGARALTIEHPYNRCLRWRQEPRLVFCGDYRDTKLAWSEIIRYSR